MRVCAGRVSGQDGALYRAFSAGRQCQWIGYRVSGYIDPVAALAAVRADLPVAMASGYLIDDLRTQALAAGVRELSNKPGTVEELGEAIARPVNSCNN